MDYIPIIAFVLLFLGFCWLAARLQEILPQMTTLKTELALTRKDLAITRAENKCLQEALARTTDSQEELQEVLRACTRSHADSKE
jgi:hypothetical protein